MTNSRQSFSENLRRLRVARGLTQADLAEKTEMTIQTISNYETGMRWPQSPDVLDILAKTLQVRPADLILPPGGSGAVPSELIEHIAAAARACGLKVSVGKNS